jgi:hypothetical protein
MAQLESVFAAVGADSESRWRNVMAALSGR